MLPRRLFAQARPAAPLPPGRSPIAEGLFAGSGRYLAADGLLMLYGPFKRDGKHTALSNAIFDTSLREGNPEWGVRDIADLEQLATNVGLVLCDVAEMPANNMILVFARK